MTPAKRKVSTEDVKEAPKQTTGLEEALGLLIHDNVGDRVKEEMDARGITEDAVQKIVMEVISKKALPQFTKRVKPKKGEPEFDLVHMRYADAKFWLDMNQSVYLNGPAGSGKTVAAQQLAQSFDNQCLIHSCHGEMTVYDLCGYMDGNGKYNPTPFYKAWKAGHIILIDEVDKAPGEVNVFLNAATAQGIITFPNGEILKKKDTCHIILTGNTKMAGADATYSTGQRQDASFSNRLVAIDWPYDKHLETMLANQEVKAYGGKPEQATEVVEKISQIRKAVATLGMSYVVGQRQTMMVSAGVATGRSQTKVYQEIVYGWMDDNDVKRIRSEVKKNA